MLDRDADYFLEVQTQTGWGRTLFGFAKWCDPQPEWRSLDIGCGPGLLPAIFSNLGCRAMGVDIDLQMFKPVPLHPILAAADIMRLPFAPQSFDLITATNLLFLLHQPVQALIEMKRLTRPGGKIALLNPSERLNLHAAMTFAGEQKLDGLAKTTLLNWAQRAEENQCWNEDQTKGLFAEAGLRYEECILKVGPGFGRYSSGRV